MTESELFINLLHRLRHYDDALVLYTAIAQNADRKELHISAAQLSLDYLQGQIARKKVQRSLNRLDDLGLVELHTQERFRSRFRVNADALRSFLQIPVPQDLPGLAEDTIAFLDDWNKQASDEADKVIKNMKQQPSSNE